MFRRAPRPLAVACGFALYALYDEDTTTHARAHTDTHAHTMRCELKSVVLAGRPQGRCCMRHRVSVSVSAAAGTGSQAQGKQAGAACGCAPYDEDTTTHAQAHTGTHAHSMRYELQAQGKQANAACAMHSNDGDGTSTAATREHSRQNQDVQCS